LARQGTIAGTEERPRVATGARRPSEKRREAAASSAVGQRAEGRGVFVTAIA
jgi:hypothetical protein